jgi:hypothetical protein
MRGVCNVYCPLVPSSIKDRFGSWGTDGQVLTTRGTAPPFGSFTPYNLEWQTPSTLNASNASTGANANITVNDTGLLQISATQGISITGNALQSGTSGGNSGQHLVITLNGQVYKIALQNP